MEKANAGCTACVSFYESSRIVSCVKQCSGNKLCRLPSSLQERLATYSSRPSAGSSGCRAGLVAREAGCMGAGCRLAGRRRLTPRGGDNSTGDFWRPRNWAPAWGAYKHPTCAGLVCPTHRGSGVDSGRRLAGGPPCSPWLLGGRSAARPRPAGGSSSARRELGLAGVADAAGARRRDESWGWRC